MTREKQQQTTNLSIAEKCFNEIEKLPEDAQLDIAKMIHGAFIANEYYRKKLKASA